MASGPLALPRTSKPAARALDDAGIRDLRDLAAWTEREVASLHGMGPKALAIHGSALAAAGLAFRDEEARARGSTPPGRSAQPGR
jgi:hypothetical protein